MINTKTEFNVNKYIQFTKILHIDSINLISRRKLKWFNIAIFSLSDVHYSEYIYEVIIYRAIYVFINVIYVNVTTFTVSELLAKSWTYSI